MRRFWSLFTLIFLGLLATNAIPQLRGGWGWQWWYDPVRAAGPILTWIGLLIMYLGGVSLSRRYQKGRLLWAALGALFLTLGMLNLRGDPLDQLFRRTVSPVYTGSSAAAVRNIQREGADSALRRWPDLMRELVESANIHIALSPPGQPLIHYAVGHWLDQVDPLLTPLSRDLRLYQCTDPEIMRYSRGELGSAVLIGMLMPLWAGLAVFPLFWIGQHLGGDREAAANLAQWWALIPSLLYFATSWNTLYPLLILCAFASLTRALAHHQMRYAVLGGAIMSLVTFLNFSGVPALMLMGWYALGYGFFLERARGFPWAVRVGLFFGAGLSSIWLIFGLYTGHTPLDILQAAFDQHLGIERNYAVWLILHVYDVILFAGWAVFGLAVWALWRAIQRLKERHPLERLDVFILAVFLTTLIVDISGFARGETARVWLFFVPFWLLGGIELQRRADWDWPLLRVQALTVAVIGLVIGSMPTFLNDPPTQPRTDVATFEGLPLIPVDFTFASQEFGGEFHLVGYRFIADPANQVINLETQWRGQVPSERPYHLEVVARAGNTVDGLIRSSLLRWYPQNGNYLSTCWREGDRVADVIQIPLPPVSQPVQWTLFLRVIDERTQDAPLIRLADRTQADYAKLGPIAYP